MWSKLADVESSGVDLGSAGVVLDQFCESLRPSAPAIDVYLEALSKIRPAKLRELLLETCNEG